MAYVKPVKPMRTQDATEPSRSGRKAKPCTAYVNPLEVVMYTRRNRTKPFRPESKAMHGVRKACEADADTRSNRTRPFRPESKAMHGIRKSPWSRGVHKKQQNQAVPAGSKQKRGMRKSPMPRLCSQASPYPNSFYRNTKANAA